MSSLEQRLAAIEARLAALEPAAPPVGQPAAASADARFAVLDTLRAQAPPGGAVVFAGSVQTPDGRQLDWQWGQPASGLAGRDWSVASAALSALAHPVRLQLLQAIYAGNGRKAELETLPGLGTSGQLYHHLRELDRAGWVRSPRRGEYEVPADRVVPLLVLLSAAGVRAV